MKEIINNEVEKNRTLEIKLKQICNLMKNQKQEIYSKLKVQLLFFNLYLFLFLHLFCLYIYLLFILFNLIMN